MASRRCRLRRRAAAERCRRERAQRSSTAATSRRGLGSWCFSLSRLEGGVSREEPEGNESRDLGTVFFVFRAERPGKVAFFQANRDHDIERESRIEEEQLAWHDRLRPDRDQ